jgi:hypothetical protein
MKKYASSKITAYALFRDQWICNQYGGVLRDYEDYGITVTVHSIRHDRQNSLVHCHRNARQENPYRRRDRATARLRCV